MKCRHSDSKGSVLLYLHIGSPKAGSTSIQAFLKDNRQKLPHEQLKAWGWGNSWKIAASSRTKWARDFWVIRRRRLTDEQLIQLSEKLWSDVRREVEQSQNSTFVASTEFGFGQVGSERAALQRLRGELLDIFSEVKIILYLRSQVSFLTSLYSQRVKGPMSDTRSFEQFFEEFRHVENALLYRQRLENWVSVFGEEHVDVVVFARENFVGGSLIADFLSRIDLHDPRILNGGVDRVDNFSPSYSELNILRRLNRLTFLSRQQRRTLASFLQKFRPVEGFPETYDERILEMVSEENEWLNSRYFSDLPVKLPVA